MGLLDAFNTVGNVAGGVGALASGFSSIFGAGKQYRRQKDLLKQQQKYQKELLQMQNSLSMQNQAEAWNKYNSPVAQRAAMKAAGINPFVEGSGGLSPQGVSAPGASAPSIPDLPDVPNTGAMIGSALQASSSSLFQMSQQAKMNEADVQLKNAQRIKLLSETKSIDNANSLFEFARSAAESDALSRKFKVQMDEFNAKLQPILAEQDVEQRRAGIANLWATYDKILAETAKTDADRLTVDSLRDLQKRSYEAGIGLTEAQTQTEKSKKANLDAETSRIELLSEPERQHLRNQAAELANRMLNASHEQKRKDLDLLFESMGLKSQSEPLLLTASLIKEIKNSARMLDFNPAFYKLFEEVYHVKLD